MNSMELSLKYVVVWTKQVGGFVINPKNQLWLRMGENISHVYEHNENFDCDFEFKFETCACIGYTLCQKGEKKD